MKKKISLILVTLAIGAFSLSCVSPFYGTARIEEGWHMDAGVAGMSEITPSLDSWGFEYHLGARADAELRYGFNSFLQLNSRIALGAAPAWPPIFADVAVGAQTAYPIGPITPALRVEVSGYGGGITFSPAVLLGIGRKEVVTLGGRIHIFGNTYERQHPHPGSVTFPEDYDPYLEDTPTDFFVGIHLGRWNILVGSQLFYHSSSHSFERPVATAGIGYKLR